MAHVRCTTRAEGDLAVDGDPAALARRRADVVDLPWLWLRQVHGADVVVVDAPAQVPALAGAEADAAVATAPGVAVAVHTADCAPVALLGRSGVVGVVHAGWRGLVAGVVQAAVARVRDAGADDVRAVLGPCVGPECYEFSPSDLDHVAAVLGPEVVGRTRTGAPALDVPAAVDRALAEAGVGPAERLGGCTACSAERSWSHRARGEAGRQAMVAWLSAPEGTDR